MKRQVLHNSFGSILVAVAVIAFMFSLTSTAQAQQGQWGRDGCFYAPSQRGQWVRQGCVLSSGGNRYYHNNATNVITDLRTKISYFQAQDGRMFILTSSGWMEAQAYLQMVRTNRANNTGLAEGTRVAANNWPGSGYAVVGGTSPSVTGNAQVDGAINKMYTNILHTWTAPNNITYVPGAMIRRMPSGLHRDSTVGKERQQDLWNHSADWLRTRVKRRPAPRPVSFHFETPRMVRLTLYRASTQDCCSEHFDDLRSDAQRHGL